MSRRQFGAIAVFVVVVLIFLASTSTIRVNNRSLTFSYGQEHHDTIPEQQDEAEQQAVEGKPFVHEPLIAPIPAPAPRKKALCNPFTVPGSIDNVGTWTPYLSTCPILRKTSFLSMSLHLRDKRFYFYGDSIIQNAVEDFCGQLGSPLETLPNPPGFRTTTEKQSIRYCGVGSLNLTVIIVPTYGLRQWDITDVAFLKAHPTIKHNEELSPSMWSIEDRMKTPHTTLLNRFGPADIVFLSSSLFDIGYLQRVITNPENTDPQTIEAPKSFLHWYASRARDYIHTARMLHPQSSKIYYLTIHDPTDVDAIDKQFGLNGYQTPSEDVKFACFTEPRVRGLREASVAAVMEENNNGFVEVEILPYDLYVRSAPVEKRMRDGIHPSVFVNEVLGTAFLWAGRLINPV